MKAAALLSTSDGKPANPATIAGALLALASIGQLKLAVTLLFELWPSEGVSLPVAVLLVERALSSTDPTLQNNAAVILELNVPRLLLKTTNGAPFYDWPPSFDCEWTSNPPSHEARYHLQGAWLSLWIEAWNENGFTSAWEGFRRQQLVSGLYAMYRREPDTALGINAGLAVLEVLRLLPDPPITTEIDGESVVIDESVRTDELELLKRRPGRSIPNSSAAWTR